MRRAEIQAVVEELATPLATARGMEIVDVDFRRQGKDWLLQVFLDKPGGVTTDDCAWVSERLGDLLDQRDPIPGRYYLQVSSPGVERPLKRDGDFERYRGHRVEVSTLAPVAGRRRFTGILEGLEAGVVRIRNAGGEVHAVPRDLVARANLKPDLDELFRRARGNGGPGPDTG